MYDYSGEWVYRVGIPAKSGVSGGIVGILPGQLAIAVFSPPLDPQGNSVRGVRVCERISHDLSLHVLRVHSTIASVVRRSYDGAAARSNHVRPVPDNEILDRDDRAIVVHELQGDLYFASMEAAFRAIADDLAGRRYVVVDLRRVVNVDNAADSLLRELAATLEAEARTLVLAHADVLGPETMPAETATRFVDVDTALDWCESQVLRAARPALVPVVGRSLAGQPLLYGLPAEQLAVLEAAATVQTTAAGEIVIREGDPADALYFVLAGRVSVRLVLADGRRDRRLAAFGPGLSFGETALVAGGVRTADVVTDEPATLARVALDDLRHIGEECPSFMATIYENLARQLSTLLQRANAQVRALDP